MDNGRASTPGLRIALVAPPMKSVPPVGYGGTERVVASLAAGLVAAGHRVTVYASGDSETAGTLEPIVPRALWDDGYKGDTASYMQIAAERIWKDSHHFDIIHSHLEGYGFLLSRYSPTPVVSTLHGRLDDGGMIDLLARFKDIPLVAISDNQRRWMPDQNWVATVPHGLPLETMPHRERHGDYLVVVGRISPEKGIGEAIELAARTNIQLRIAAKLHRPEEYEMFESVVKPAIDAGSVSYLGELQAEARDPVLAGALATLMLGGWPEPFGLVAIESLAAGTPVIARRAGALPEIIEPGVDGFLVDDLREAELALRRVPDLDRALIRKRALERFSVERMTRDYEAVYAKVLGERATSQSVYQQHDPAPIPIGYHVDGPDLSDGQRQVGDPSRIIRRRHRPAGASCRAVAPSGDRS
jgi:glycosyltransferase involved in cell wall biosynthesis